MSIKFRGKTKDGMLDMPIRKKYGNVPTHAIVGDKEYDFKSKAEIKLAKYLQLLKEMGHIKDWLYENTKFCFPSEQDPVKTWLVDFDVLENDGSFHYIEYKGYVEPDTKRKLFLLNQYRPEVKIVMIFASRKQLRKLGNRATSYCKRTCLLSELTRGII